MRRQLVAFVAGALFGAGLLIAGMTQPAKVIGFLDITGAWDPTLGFVMAGAVAVYALAVRKVTRHERPWLAEQFHLPPTRPIDARLVVGAAVFGIGWGLSGFCPGPGLVAAGGFAPTALVFVTAMCGGMLLVRRE
jgi:uncharacterized protein